MPPRCPVLPRDRGCGGPPGVGAGHVTAYFCSGKLMRVWVHAGGEYLDEVFYQLTQLFELCTKIGGYLDQQAVVSL